MTDAGGPDTTQPSKQVNSGGASAEPKGSRTDPGRLGRALGISLFWLLACYVIGMSAVSIIPSLYWPELGPRPQAPGLEFCAREIQQLDDGLLALAAGALHGGNPTERARALNAWDARFDRLAGGCGPLEGARIDLLRLRRGIDSLLRRYDRGPMRAQERIRRALAQLGEGAGRTDPKGPHERD